MKVNKTIARIVFLLYLAVLMYLCFGKFQGIQQAPHGFFGIEGDKVVHFLMFLPFPILSYFAFPFPPHRAWHSVLLVLCILAVGSAFAAGTELIQDFIPYREADTADFTADFLALCLSSAAVLALDLNKTARND